ncbi:MAG: hypothetical protein Q9208_005757 [Pyrenodesmia sp. 3 TL-2023]
MRLLAILYLHFFLICRPAGSVPLQASALVPVDSDHETSIVRHPAITNPTEPFTNANPNSSDLSTTTNLKFFTLTWPLTPTLSLLINVGPWHLPPSRILACLTAANRTVYKKPGTQILERKFKQEQGSRVNTLLFEIGPEIGVEPKRMTWADVALVLGRDGLWGFFVRERYWTSVYFDVVDGRWGKVGEGAVRKWYQ